MKTIIGIATLIIFCIYLAILTKLILFKYLPIFEIINHFDFNFNEYQWKTSNLIPFKTIHYYLFLADINFSIRIENLAGNIIGFVPFGFILPILTRKILSTKTIIIATFCLSLTYEIVQLVFEFGSFDVDDIILNTLGGVIGYFLIKLIYLIVYSKKKNKISNFTLK